MNVTLSAADILRNPWSIRQDLNWTLTWTGSYRRVCGPAWKYQLEDGQQHSEPAGDRREKRSWLIVKLRAVMKPEAYKGLNFLLKSAAGERGHHQELIITRFQQR